MISEKPKRKLTSKQRPLLSSRAAFSETASSSISSSLCSSLGLWTTRCSALLSSVRYGPLDSNHESTQLLRGTVSRFEAALLRMLTTHFPPLAACWDPTVPRVDAAADPRIRRQTHDIPGSPCKIILHMQGILPACARMLCLSDCSDKGLPATATVVFQAGWQGPRLSQDGQRLHSASHSEHYRCCWTIIMRTERACTAHVSLRRDTATCSCSGWAEFQKMHAGPEPQK